jgi:ELWxxDGT repeat protein
MGRRLVQEVKAMKFLPITGSLALVAGLITGVTPVAAATGPYLVKDINTSGDSIPVELTALNGKLLFSARGGGKGRELWISDGTPTGTHRVKDIRPGTASSNPDHLTAIGGLLYFDAEDGVHGRELWVSDGTGPGTVMLKDINSTGSSQPWSFTEFNGLVYFAADDGVSGRELWRTDGTGPGTKRFKDIAPGPGSSDPGALTSFAGQLFFVRSHCPTPACYATLFKSNGTSAGTKPLRDNHGDKITGQINFLVHGGAFLFWSMDETELWRSRLGEASKTKKIADIAAWNITSFASLVAFTVSGQLWVSGGSASNTIALGQTANHLVYVNGQLLFFDDERVWATDGTVEGTKPGELVLTSFGQFAVIANVLYFDGYSNESATAGLTHGVPAPLTTLWVTDGEWATDMGGGNYPSEITTVGTSVFYAARDDDHGIELWRYSPV